MPIGSDPKTLEIKVDSALTAKNRLVDQRLDAYVENGVLNDEQVNRIIGFLDSQPEVALLVLDMLDQRRDGKVGTLELMPAAEFETMIATAQASPAPPHAKPHATALCCDE